ncbi:hypothetical protein Tco_1463234, partial [Tanacetum coccineum]
MLPPPPNNRHSHRHPTPPTSSRHHHLHHHSTPQTPSPPQPTLRTTILVIPPSSPQPTPPRVHWFCSVTTKGAFGSHHTIRLRGCLAVCITPKGAIGFDKHHKGAFGLAETTIG